MSRRHMWTKEEIKKIITVWETKTIEQMADLIGVSKSAVQTVAGKLRKAGVKLASKHRKGYLDSLIKEVAKEVRK